MTPAIIKTKSSRVSSDNRTHLRLFIRLSVEDKVVKRVDKRKCNTVELCLHLE